jgi:undecaprenyl-phosphate 4-deoxy-4-formamido-L-arabinose transferase
LAEQKIPFLSVVIPLYNEEENVETLVGRLFPVLHDLGDTFEAVLVDDGSADRTLELLLAARKSHPELVVLSFVRNYGQHAAVTAGFESARGDFVITLDADLQNPPEEIPKIVAEFKKGHDLVGTIRRARRDSWFRRRASAAVNAVTRKISGIHLHDFGCMLRGYSRDIAKAIASRREHKTFIPALGFLFARDPVEIPVEHDERLGGVSKYSFRQLLRLNLDLMAGFSMAPLRFLIGTGFLVAGAGIAFGVLLLVFRFAFGAEWAAQGVFTLFAILFFFVGAQFVAFGLLGEYIGRIFEVVRMRPPYVLRDLDGEGNGAVGGAGEGEAG